MIYCLGVHAHAVKYEEHNEIKIVTSKGQAYLEGFCIGDVYFLS